jgi:septum formation protein
MDLVLASSSSIRKQLLRAAGLPFLSLLGDADEPAPSSGEAAEDYVMRCAEAKARGALRCHRERLDEALIIGCDQVVRFEGRILRKVDRASQAIARLVALQAAPHELVGGLAIIDQAGAIRRRSHSIVRVALRSLSTAQVSRYVTREMPLSSVACYYLEGEGFKLIERLDGDYHSALGLPLSDIISTLAETGHALF